jgi:hypothetical protein
LTADFAAVEARLRAILDPYRDRLESDSLYGVDTLNRPGGGAHDFFAGVRQGKRYVSFHLMPIYALPDLVANISPELRKRMQGKSCFNFTTVDENLMTELDALTKRSFAHFTSAAYPRAPKSTRS